MVGWWASSVAEKSGLAQKHRGDSAGSPFGVHGGAGNRTLVRVSFQNHVYVRRLDFLPSLQSGIEPTSPKPIS